MISFKFVPTIPEVVPLWLPINQRGVFGQLLSLIGTPGRARTCNRTVYASLKLNRTRLVFSFDAH